MIPFINYSNTNNNKIIIQHDDDDYEKEAIKLFNNYQTFAQLKDKQKRIQMESIEVNQNFWVTTMVFGALIIFAFIYFTILLSGWNAQIKSQAQNQRHQFKSSTEINFNNLKKKVTLLETEIQKVQQTNKKNQQDFQREIQNINSQFDTLKKKTQQINKNIAQVMIQENLINLVQIDSRVVPQHQFQTLLSFFQEPIAQFKLIYRASQNKFSIQKFHQKCDKIPNTLVLIKTTTGAVIGGFTPLLWDKSKDSIFQQDKTNSSFIFSLKLKQKMNLIKSGSAIRNYKSIGPAFSGDTQRADLIIFDDANNKQSILQFPTSYNNENKYEKSPETTQKFLGKTNNKFKVEEWEVHEIKFR